MSHRVSHWKETERPLAWAGTDFSETFTFANGCPGDSQGKLLPLDPCGGASTVATAIFDHGIRALENYASSPEDFALQNQTWQASAGSFAEESSGPASALPALPADLFLDVAAECCRALQREEPAHTFRLPMEVEDECNDGDSYDGSLNYSRP